MGKVSYCQFITLTLCRSWFKMAKNDKDEDNVDGGDEENCNDNAVEYIPPYAPR